MHTFVRLGVAFTDRLIEIHNYTKVIKHEFSLGSFVFRARRFMVGVEEDGEGGCCPTIGETAKIVYVHAYRSCHLYRLD